MQYPNISIQRADLFLSVKVAATVLLLFLVVGTFSGCATGGSGSSAVENARLGGAAMPTMPAVELSERPDSDENPGSLFDSQEADYLFADSRARRVGDIVLVNVVENNRASNKADTKADRSNDLSFGVNNFLGQNKLLGVNTGATPWINTSMTSEFEGEGETTRENSIYATVAARVTRLHPGGVMEVAGARETRVNAENQIVVVRGLVRPRDIGPDNSVLSTHLAESSIEFYGEGVVSDKQRPGWLSRMLDNVWPF